jgi:hypothetical protein
MLASVGDKPQNPDRENNEGDEKYGADERLGDEL